MPFDTPLRYPGGKGRLSGFMKEVIELNGLTDGHYVEPYAGGAGIAITLLLNGVVSHVHINDLNRSIFAFWDTVLHNTAAFCQRIEETEVTIEEWNRQKAVQNDLHADIFDLAFSTFFLNRTNRSGIIKGGVIGGKEQLGKWRLDARYNKKALIGRIEKIGGVADRVSLYWEDAFDFIHATLPKLPKKTMVYLDPPYYEKGKGLYKNHYKFADHFHIGQLVSGIKQPWLITYDDIPEIRKIYRTFKKSRFELQYSAQWRYKGTEVLITPNELKLPKGVRVSRSLTLHKEAA